MQERNIFTIRSRAPETVGLNNDYILPDYITDVKKLLHYKARSHIHNVFNNGKTLNLEGEIVYSAYILCEDESIKNVIYSEDFIIGVKDIDVDEQYIYDCRIDKHSVRLLSPRKLNCRADIVVTVKTNTAVDTIPIYRGIGIPEAEHTAQTKTIVGSYIRVFDEYIKNQHGVCDVALPSVNADIMDIIYTSLDIRINEQKLIDGKLFLRGNGVADILYADTEGSMHKINDSFSFSEILENGFDTDAHRCNIEITDIKAVFNSAHGEKGSVEIDYTYDICHRSYVNGNADVLSDLYSTEYDVELVRKSVETYRLCDVFDGRMTVDDNYLCEGEDEVVNRIVDCFATVQNSSIVYNSGKLILTGDVKFDVVCVADGIKHISVIKPFKYEKDITVVSKDVMCEYNAFVMFCNASVDNGRIVLTAEIAYNATVFESCEYKFISEVEFKSPCDTVSSPVIIYYPSPKDTLWEIAKRYKCTCSDIMTANKLDNESIEGIKVLLLPRKRPKSVFNAII